MICINTNQSQILELGVKIEETLNLFSDLTNYKTKMVKESDLVINENLYKKLQILLIRQFLKLLAKKCSRKTIKSGAKIRYCSSVV